MQKPKTRAEQMQIDAQRKQIISSMLENRSASIKSLIANGRIEINQFSSENHTSEEKEKFLLEFSKKLKGEIIKLHVQSLGEIGIDISGIDRVMKAEFEVGSEEQEKSLEQARLLYGDSMKELDRVVNDVIDSLLKAQKYDRYLDAEHVRLIWFAIGTSVITGVALAIVAGSIAAGAILGGLPIAIIAGTLGMIMDSPFIIAAAVAADSVAKDIKELGKGKGLSNQHVSSVERIVDESLVQDISFKQRFEICELIIKDFNSSNPGKIMPALNDMGLNTEETKASDLRKFINAKFPYQTGHDQVEAFMSALTDALQKNSVKIDDTNSPLKLYKNAITNTITAEQATEVASAIKEKLDYFRECIKEMSQERGR